LFEQQLILHVREILHDLVKDATTFQVQILLFPGKLDVSSKTSWRLREKLFISEGSSTCVSFVCLTSNATIQGVLTKTTFAFLSSDTLYTGKERW
jgi:hypothetical protein